MRLGELNVYWYGLPEGKGPDNVQFRHGPEDDGRVRDLLASLDVRLLALVEIVDVARMEAILGQLPGAWTVRDEQGRLVCSEDPPANGTDALQRVLLAWNREAIELVRWSRPLTISSGRQPVVARLRTLATHNEWTVVAIHPRSGILTGWEALPPTDRSHVAGLARTELFDKLAAWLAGPRAGYAGPAIVVGDFNSLAGSPETKALRDLPGWRWPVPGFEPPTADHATTKTDAGAIIDHAVLSPELVHERPEVVAFDLLDAFPEPADPSNEVWKRTTDHRPLRIDVSV